MTQPGFLLGNAVYQMMEILFRLRNSRLQLLLCKLRLFPTVVLGHQCFQGSSFLDMGCSNGQHGMGVVLLSLCQLPARFCLGDLSLYSYQILCDLLPLAGLFMLSRKDGAFCMQGADLVLQMRLLALICLDPCIDQPGCFRRRERIGLHRCQLLSLRVFLRAGDIPQRVADAAPPFVADTLLLRRNPG